MPKFLKAKLQAEYGAKSAVPYKVMNTLGAMLGNKETAKGREMQAKHDAKMNAQPAAVPKASGKAASLASHPNASRLGKYLHPAKKR